MRQSTHGGGLASHGLATHALMNDDVEDKKSAEELKRPGRRCDCTQVETCCLLSTAFGFSLGFACLGMFCLHMLNVAKPPSGAIETLVSRPGRVGKGTGQMVPLDWINTHVPAELSGPLEFSLDRVKAINRYFATDTDNYDPHLVASATDMLKALWKNSAVGLLLIDHSNRGESYSALRGGARSDAGSFGFRIERWMVEGLTFEAVERGLGPSGEFPPSEFRVQFANGSRDAYWSKQWEAVQIREGYKQVKTRSGNDGYFADEDYAHGIVYRYEPKVLHDNVKNAVRNLERLGAKAISGDEGLLMYYQDTIANISQVPVGMSAVLQLSMIKFHLGGNAKRKVLLLTTDSDAFDVEKMIPPSVMARSDVKQHVVVVGLQHTTYAKWLFGGNTFSRLRRHAKDGASIEAVIPTIIDAVTKKMQELQEGGAEVVAILSESTTLPAVSNAMRYHLNLPVYDAWTLFGFLAAGRKVGLYSAFIA